jgi:hypothetical protein
MSNTMTSGPGGRHNETKALASPLRFVQLLEGTLILALCSHFYLRWGGRKQVSQSSPKGVTLYLRLM